MMNIDDEYIIVQYLGTVFFLSIRTNKDCIQLKI